MPKIQIAIIGCDDTTYFTADVNDEEFALLRAISTASVAASESSCKPRFKVTEIIQGRDPGDETPESGYGHGV